MSHRAEPVHHEDAEHYEDAEQQAYSPWTVVNVVFAHLVDQGLTPSLGTAGDPGEPAARLLQALGIAASVEGDPRISRRTHDELAQMRALMVEQEH
ncbi:MAG: hypothetical protein ACRDZT_03490 [Acidimicrobiales bacterium]